MRVKEKMRERNDLPKWREASGVGDGMLEHSVIMTEFSELLQNVYCVPSSVLSTSCIFTHMIPTIVQEGGEYYYSHFIDEQPRHRTVK